MTRKAGHGIVGVAIAFKGSALNEDEEAIMTTPSGLGRALAVLFVAVGCAPALDADGPNTGLQVGDDASQTPDDARPDDALGAAGPGSPGGMMPPLPLFDGAFRSLSCPDADGDGVTTCAGDCDDNEPYAYPGSREWCDNFDNDCDGDIDEGFDNDGDGVASCWGDCDDTDPTVYDKAPETCNGVDDDCDGTIDEGYDLDSDGVTTCDGDCDDNDDAVNPDEDEICDDGIDNDCDGDIDSDDGAECDVCVTYTLGDADGYNVFVFGDYIDGVDVQGHVAAGGDVVMSSFGIGYSNRGGDAVVAGDTLDLTHGTVYGDAWYGLYESVDATVDIRSGGLLQQGSPIDFAAAEAYLLGASTALASAPANGTTAVASWGGVTLTGTDPTLNVFDLAGSDLEAAVWFELDAPAGSVVLVNVSGNNLSWGNFYMNLVGVDERTVLYHFPDATDLEMGGIGVRGSILAPLADVTFDNGNFDGNLVAASLTGTAEGHHFPWDGVIELCP